MIISCQRFYGFQSLVGLLLLGVVEGNATTLMFRRGHTNMHTIAAILVLRTCALYENKKAVLWILSAVAMVRLRLVPRIVPPYSCGTESNLSWIVSRVVVDRDRRISLHPGSMYASTTHLCIDAHSADLVFLFTDITNPIPTILTGCVPKEVCYGRCIDVFRWFWVPLVVCDGGEWAGFILYKCIECNAIYAAVICACMGYKALQYGER